MSRRILRRSHASEGIARGRSCSEDTVGSVCVVCEMAEWLAWQSGNKGWGKAFLREDSSVVMETTHLDGAVSLRLPWLPFLQYDPTSSQDFSRLSCAISNVRLPSSRELG